MNLLVLSPLPLEMDALLLQMSTKGYLSETKLLGPLKIIEFPDLGWKFSLAGHGKTQFGIQTQFLISQIPELDAVVCAGCAGGLVSHIAIFDVVVAEKTIEHDYRLRFINRPEPEFPGDYRLIERIGKNEREEFRVHFGAVASGDEDIVEPSRASELQLQTGAIAVAWEGAGGARACKFNQIPFLEIRGVTDTANNTAPVDFAANLQISMRNVCEVLLDAFT